jgi:hypothetical protein
MSNEIILKHLEYRPTGNNEYAMIDSIIAVEWVKELLRFRDIRCVIPLTPLKLLLDIPLLSLLNQAFC